MEGPRNAFNTPPGDREDTCNAPDGAPARCPPSDRPPLPQSALVAQLRALGLATVPVVLVHSSLRAVGPLGLIAALRAALPPYAALVMPSTSDDDDHPFDAATTPCAAMGVDHSANTTMHLAESMVGVPYASRKECVVMRDGVPARVDG